MAFLVYRAAYDQALGGEADVLQRSTMAGVRAALDVYAEAGATPGHAARAVLATKVLNSPDSYGRMFAFVVAVTVQQGAGAFTDANVLSAINASWNALAGA